MGADATSAALLAGNPGGAASARLDLFVAGVPLRFSGDAEAVSELGVHFRAFVPEIPSDEAPRVAIHLERSEPQLPIARRLAASQVLERGVVYNDGPRCIIDHHGRASSYYDFETDSGVIRSREPARLVELGYLMAHSRLGQLLEARGLVRLHCLAVARGGRAGIVLAPSGGGKSRLGLEALAGGELDLLGDDLVLVDPSGRVHPWPSPPSVGRPEMAGELGPLRRFERSHHPTKWVVELDALLDRFAAGPHDPAFVALLTRVSNPPDRLRPTPRGDIAAALWRDMVVGLGLPQVLELVARRGSADLWSQLPSVGKRSRAALNLLRRARPMRLEVHDPAAAVEALAAALRD